MEDRREATQSIKKGNKEREFHIRKVLTFLEQPRSGRVVSL